MRYEATDWGGNTIWVAPNSEYYGQGDRFESTGHTVLPILTTWGGRIGGVDVSPDVLKAAIRELACE